MTVEKDLAYDDQIRERRYDLFLPADRPDAPLVALIHGGGWITGDSSSYHDEAAWLVSQGYAAACVSYRLAPLYPFPAAVADIQAFLAHARQNPNGHPYNPEKIITFGNSAGGHLAAMAGLLQKHIITQEPLRPADAFISVAPITDLREPAQTQFPIAISFIEQFMGATHYEEPELYAQASPVSYVTPQAPPSLLIHGALDDVVPVRQTEALHESLDQARAQTSLHVFPHDYHAFSPDSWLAIRRLTLEFLQSL